VFVTQWPVCCHHHPDGTCDLIILWDTGSGRLHPVNPPPSPPHFFLTAAVRVGMIRPLSSLGRPLVADVPVGLTFCVSSVPLNASASEPVFGPVDRPRRPNRRVALFRRVSPDAGC